MCGRQWLIGALCIVFSSAIPVAHAQNVQLNFKEADLDAVINWVAELTGRNFIVDPRVKAKVTIVSGRPLNKDEAYQVFLSVLQVHGFSAVEGKRVTKIVPDVNAKSTGVPVTGEDDPSHGDEMVTRIIQVQNVSAAQLVPILRPLVPQQGHMAAYPATNMLIVSDRAVNIDRLVELIQRVDQPSVENEIEVIPLQHASASEVVRIMTTLDQQAGQQAARAAGETLEGRPTLVADERTNSILVSGGKSNRLRLRTIISHLDIPLEREGNIHVMYLRYANAKELVPVLTGVGQVVSQEEAKKGGGGGAPAAASRGGSDFNIQADESTNSLVITAPLEVFRSLQSVIRQLDVRRAQVLVEGVIAELTMNRAAELGVQWALDGTPAGNKPVGGTNFGSGTGGSLVEIIGAVESNKAPVLGDGLVVGLGRFNSDTLNFAALIKALRGDGTTNVLSTPTLVTLDNEEAEIIVGQEVPFITGSFSNTGGSGSSPTNPFQTINRKDVGISLKVKPQINEGNTVKLDVEQKLDSVAAGVKGAADLITNKRSIKTSLLVDDGEVVVLGGLIKDDLRESVQRVPLLGDIPLLGTLFSYKNTTKEKTNLMVFLHPVIMRDAALMEQVSSSKYNYIRGKQLAQRERGVALLRDKEAPVMPPLEKYLRPPAPPQTALPPGVELTQPEGEGARAPRESATAPSPAEPLAPSMPPPSPAPATPAEVVPPPRSEVSPVAPAQESSRPENLAPAQHDQSSGNPIASPEAMNAGGGGPVPSGVVAAESEPPVPAIPVQIPEPQAEGWVVQLASLGSERRASELRNNLREKGYNAFVQPAGNFYRVRVGPELTREDALALREELNRAVGMKGIVRQSP